MSSIDAQLERIQKAFEAKERAKAKEQAKLSEQAEQERLLELNTVTKSNALIRAFYKFTLAEKRCMEALISKLNPLESNPPILSLSALEYSKLYGIDGSLSYKQIASAVDGLVNKVILVQSPTIATDYAKYSLMSKAEYKASLGLIECRFAQDIFPHLQHLKSKFTSYPLKNAASFKSGYTWRMYELLSSWAKPKSQTGGVFAGWLKIEVDELRSLLGVPESYKWAMFEKKALDMAVNELRDIGGIHLKIERIKTSRKITHLQISFIKPENNTGGTEEEQHEMTL